jgi:hypothetical protein
MSPQLPPLSSKARKAAEAEEARTLQKELYSRSHIEKGLLALFAAWRDLAHVEIDDQNNPGYAELVIHIKGEAASDVFQKHGFHVEGQSGFYTATYRGSASQ